MTRRSRLIHRIVQARAEERVAQQHLERWHQGHHPLGRVYYARAMARAEAIRGGRRG